MVDKMLQDVNHAESSIITESDKWVAKYKCVAHFVNLQKIADKYNVPVICCYGITGHGKEKVDHLGSLSKVSFQPEVDAGKNLTHSEEMLSFLKTKFNEKPNLLYIFKDISSEELHEERIWKV